MQIINTKDVERKSSATKSNLLIYTITLMNWQVIPGKAKTQPCDTFAPFEDIPAIKIHEANIKIEFSLFIKVRSSYKFMYLNENLLR